MIDATPRKSIATPGDDRRQRVRTPPVCRPLDPSLRPGLSPYNRTATGRAMSGRRSCDGGSTPKSKAMALAPHTRWCLARCTASTHPSMNERERERQQVPAWPWAAGSMVPAVGRTCLGRSWRCPRALSHWLIAWYRAVARDNTRPALPILPTLSLNPNEFRIICDVCTLTSPSSTASLLGDPVLLLASSSVGKFNVYAKYRTMYATHWKTYTSEHKMRSYRIPKPQFYISIFAIRHSGQYYPKVSTGLHRVSKVHNCSWVDLHYIICNSSVLT